MSPGSCPGILRKNFFRDMLLSVPPVADRLCEFLLVRDVFSLAMTCSSLQRELFPLFARLVSELSLTLVDDFDRFRSVLKATNSYLELDDRCHRQLRHPCGSYMARGMARHVYVGGPHVMWKVMLLKQYFVFELGYEVQYEFSGTVG